MLILEDIQKLWVGYFFLNKTYYCEHREEIN